MSSTPILDLLQDPPEPGRNRVRLALEVAIGVAVGVALAIKVPYVPGRSIFVWLAALYVSVLVHEMGHLVAGKLAGMDPGGLAIGGFHLFKSGDRWVFRFDHSLLSLAAGFAQPLPVKGKLGADRFALMVAGGPAASILFTILCGIAILRFGNGTRGWIGSPFWTALITGVTSLWPMSRGIVKSDGTWLWELLRYPAESRSWIDLSALLAEDARGVLPRNWDTELVESALKTEPSRGVYSYCQLLAFYRCLDQRDNLTAIQYLENALAGSARDGKMLRQCYFVEAACASASIRENSSHARTWLDRASKLQKLQSRDGVDAAIAMSEKRYADALRHFAAAREFIERRRLDSGLARFAKERIAEGEAECRAALARVGDPVPRV